MEILRQRDATAFTLRDPLPWDQFASLARQGESLGYSAVFLPETGGRDGFAALTGIAGETHRLLLGTGVVPMTARTLRATASGAATVQERSGGRLILGVGTGGARTGALEELRTWVLELRRLLDAKPREGGLSLQVGEAVPVWVAALGRRAMSLAGEVADGVVLNWSTPRRVAEAAEIVGEAARSAGRDPNSVTVSIYIRAAVGERSESLDALRVAAGEYASYATYGRPFAEMGLGPEAEAAAKAFVAGRTNDVPAELVDAVCLPSDAEAARERLAEYRAAGAHLPVVYPVPIPADPARSVMCTLEALAPVS